MLPSHQLSALNAWQIHITSDSKGSLEPVILGAKALFLTHLT